MSYLGYLAGHETIADCMKDEALAHFVGHLMNVEVTSTLMVPPGAEFRAYKQALLRRFRNPGLRHRTWQIAMDGSQKLPQRLLGTIRDRLKAGAPIDAPGAGRCRLDALRDRHRREGPADRRARSAARRTARNRADAAGPTRAKLAPALLGRREDLRPRPSRRSPLHHGRHRSTRQPDPPRQPADLRNFPEHRIHEADLALVRP